MAKSAVPLLLLGGVALLVMSKKKGSGYPSGPLPDAPPVPNGGAPRPSGGGSSSGGSAGTASREVWKDRQRALGFLGYSVGDIDGLYGPATENALRSFQKDAKVPVTGSWDQPTAEAMRRVGLQRLASMSWDKVRDIWNYYFPQWGKSGGDDNKIDFDILFDKLTAIVT
jgi:peptidoglycan hydrolase-like protein with peptidoglycan-binding domain